MLRCHSTDSRQAGARFIKRFDAPICKVVTLSICEFSFKTYFNNDYLISIPLLVQVPHGLLHFLSRPVIIVSRFEGSILFELYNPNHFSDHIPSFRNSLVQFLITVRGVQCWYWFVVGVVRITGRTILDISQSLFPLFTHVSNSLWIVMSYQYDSFVKISDERVHNDVADRVIVSL